MPRRGQDDKGAKTLPTADEIREACAAIQSEWSPAIRQKRSGDLEETPVDITDGRLAEYTGKLGFDGGDDYEVFTSELDKTKRHRKGKE